MTKTALVTGGLGIRKEELTVPTLDTIDASWLACAVDGEGHIGLYHEQPVVGKWPVVTVLIYNTDKNFVEHAAKLMSGHVSTYAQNGDIRGHRGSKQMYRGGVKGHRMVLAVLKQIEPYLIIKKEKARYVINFIESRQWGSFRWPEERRKQVSEIAIKSWQDPVIRAKRLSSINREKMRKSQLKAWKDPNKRKKRLGAISEYNANRRKIS